MWDGSDGRAARRTTAEGGCAAFHRGRGEAFSLLGRATAFRSSASASGAEPLVTLLRRSSLRDAHLLGERADDGMLRDPSSPGLARLFGRHPLELLSELLLDLPFHPNAVELLRLPHGQIASRGGKMRMGEFPIEAAAENGRVCVDPGFSCRLHRHCYIPGPDWDGISEACKPFLGERRVCGGRHPNRRLSRRPEESRLRPSAMRP